MPPDPALRGVPVTFFDTYAASTKREEVCTLSALAERIRTTTAPEKALLPWLKFARFGELRSMKGSLRHDSNVRTITGIEADYDGGEATIEWALEVLTFAGLRSLLYTSPSHTVAAPRWRVLCPTSQELPLAARARLVDRLNGLLRGKLASESWTGSQSYYYGSVLSSPFHQVAVVDGTPIDQMDELDASAIGKSQPQGAPQPASMFPHTLSEFGPSADPLDVTAALAAIPNDGAADWVHWNTVGLATWAATSGSTAGYAAWVSWSERHPTHDPAPCAERWTHYTTSPPTRSGAGTLFHMAAKARAGWTKPTDAAREAPQNAGRNGRDAGRPDPWPEPVDFLAAGDLVAAPLLQADHVPDALYPFAADTAKRMGVDPASVALSALVCCASCISEEWAVQPKRRDYTWTENARLWAAIVGEPSILKSPVIAACTRPIDKLDAEARARHVEAMKVYRPAVAAARADKSGLTPEPPYPRLDRYLVEGATVEASSEVLRDDDEAKQRAPQGKVLSRHDEMSEFFGGLDRYKGGGKGGSDRGAYLRLFNGGRYTADRIGRGTFAVPSWSACFLGGVQPGPIQRIAREAADDGLLQRFMYVVPDGQGRGEDAAPDAAAAQRYGALFPALVALHPGRPLGDGPTPSVVLDEGAHQHREHVDAMARALAGMPDTSARLKTALEKWPGLFARLALTFHLVDVADARVQRGLPPVLQVIPATTAGKVAAFMLEVLLPHLQRADALMFLSEQSGHATWIAGYILAHGLTKITTRDVTRAYGALRPPEMKRELASVMESLVTVGWLEPEQSSNPAKKDASTWQVNPAVHTRYAERTERERERRRQARESIAAAVTLRRAAQEARDAA